VKVKPYHRRWRLRTSSGAVDGSIERTRFTPGRQTASGGQPERRRSGDGVNAWILSLIKDRRDLSIPRSPFAYHGYTGLDYLAAATSGSYRGSQAQGIQVTGRDSGFDRVSVLSSVRQRRVGRPAETRTALKDWADYLTRSQRACNAGFDPTLFTLEEKYHLRVNPGFKIDSPLL